ncbi:MAG TPA: phosphoenolpyruvate carboxylase, partial [Myxococcaceae bacterium]
MSSRSAARREMPPALRKEVRLLGDTLGQVLVEFGGEDLLSAVEQLRQTVIAARESDDEELAAARLVASFTVERSEQVARAFTCYFQLVNHAEERHRARALRERERDATPLAESLAETIDEIRSRHGDDLLHELLSDLVVQPVLTAHPTESRRRAVVGAVTRVGAQLEVLEDPRASDREQREARRRMLEEIDILWRTAQLRSTQLRPLDEVRSVMTVFDESLFETVTEIYRDLEHALARGTGATTESVRPFLRFGTWVGGDRDGNPSVTSDVTRQAMEIQADHVLRGLESAAGNLARALTVDAVTTRPDAELLNRLEQARRMDPAAFVGFEARSHEEPHRQLLFHVAQRIRATRVGDPNAYRDPGELVADLHVAQRSLAEAGAGRLGLGGLQELIWQVKTFGFHLAELEVRQHGRVHEMALADLARGSAHSAETVEVLATFRAMKEIQARFGREACSRYVVSFAGEVADVSNVFRLAEAAMEGGAPPVLDVVPLFETVAGLARAPAVLDAMLALPEVRAQLERDGRLEVMLGYSDSTKEVGPISAGFALYDAQAALVKWSAARGVRLTMFHGRGGALGRGGGPANRAVRAQAPGSIAGHFKVTEQGEVVFARYLNPTIARRHLEQVASAVLMSSLPEVLAVADHAAERFADLKSRIDPPARAAYKGLIGADGFDAWFARVSPLDELSRLRLGSRPARRGQGTGLAELRAIPWVFAWSQMRLNLPGWYGMGSGLAGADLDELRAAYAEWPLFN